MSIANVALCLLLEESLCFPGSFTNQYGPCSSESILVYLVVAGSVVPMCVMESNSIALVKIRIQNHKGFFFFFFFFFGEEAEISF